MTHGKNGASPDAPLRLIPLEVRLSDVFQDAGPLEEVTLVRTQERSEFPPGTPTIKLRVVCRVFDIVPENWPEVLIFPKMDM